MSGALIGSLKPGRRAVASALGIGVSAGVLGVAVAGAASPTGIAAGRTGMAAGAISLSEKAQLHRTGTVAHGTKLNEQGSTSGTIAGTIYIHLNLASTSRVTAEVNIYPSNGSLSGYASASYHVLGAYASFSGTMSITRGTGHYDHAHATGLHFAGSIKRVNDATTVEVSGKLFS
jgi:hypothetical protein